MGRHADTALHGKADVPAVISGAEPGFGPSCIRLQGLYLSRWVITPPEHARFFWNLFSVLATVLGKR